MDSSGFLRLSPSSGFCCPSQGFFVFLRPIPKFFVLLRPLLASSILLHPPPSFSVLIQPPPAFYGLSRVLRSHPLGAAFSGHICLSTASPSILRYFTSPGLLCTSPGPLMLLRLSPVSSGFCDFLRPSSSLRHSPALFRFLRPHPCFSRAMAFSGLICSSPVSSVSTASLRVISDLLRPSPASSTFRSHPFSCGIFQSHPVSSVLLRHPQSLSGLLSLSSAFSALCHLSASSVISHYHSSSSVFFLRLPPSLSFIRLRASLVFFVLSALIPPPFSCLHLSFSALLHPSPASSCFLRLPS